MKKEPMEEADLDREPWLGPMLRQSPLVTAEGCFDAEILAAWADGALDARKPSMVELHASNCSRCMAMLASIERTRPEVEAPPKRAWADRVAPAMGRSVDGRRDGDCDLGGGAESIAHAARADGRPAGYVCECSSPCAGDAGARTGAES